MPVKKSSAGKAASKKSPSDTAPATSTTRKASSKFGAVGDLVCVPFKRDVIGYAQIVEMRTKESGLVRLLVGKSRECSAASIEALEPSADQFKIELTGIAWDHWKVVGNRPAPKPIVLPDKGTYPCFVAELKFVDALKRHGVIAPSWRLYDEVPSQSPKLRPAYIEMLSAIMRFLHEQRLLTKEGQSEIASGGVPGDFSMTSDALTPEGVRFYERVYEKGSMDDYFFADTRKKIEKLWREFKE